MQKIIQRFLSYVAIDTQSDENSNTIPSTEKQRNLAHLLVQELQELQLQDVHVDENSYVMATLPSNVDFKVPTIGFVAHLDTSPDFNGSEVKTKIFENYQGNDLILDKEKNIVLSPKYFKDLLLYKGQTLITTDGNSLLGADDKAGITEIVTAMEYLINHPEIKHGEIKICFTPDEEIGRGADCFDVEKFGASWAYTIDGSRIGELEYENFNAAKASLIFKGKSVHPGYAKNKMINSVLLANKFLSKLPKEQTPEKTSGMEGFYHVQHIEGGVEETKVEISIRDFDFKNFKKRKRFIEDLVNKINKKYFNKFESDIVVCRMQDQYFNMREKIEPVMHIVDLARKAMKDVGVKPIVKPIRGGTDGAELSYKGLPCPNIFAGGHNFHGKYEFIPVESMQKAVEVIVRIARLTAEQSK